LKAIKRARKGDGPTFIEAKTIRFREHDIGTPDLLGATPRTKQQIDQLRARDPVELALRHVRDHKILSEAEIDEIYETVDAEVAAAEKFADDSPIPDVTEAELMQDVFFEGAKA